MFGINCVYECLRLTVVKHHCDVDDKLHIMLSIVLGIEMPGIYSDKSTQFSWSNLVCDGLINVCGRILIEYQACCLFG